MNTTVRSLFVAAALFALAEGWPASTAAQDLGALLSPGPLSAAHANLEGIKTCDSCHEPGQGISTKKCLSCHKPIAERMAAGKGVHREVTGDCAMCHAEHAGRDADIRPLDISDFDHFEETGFPLDGMHASLAGDCAKCHTTRSYLAVTPECSTCHKDPHGGVLGVTCANCHAASAAFLETGMAFDHSTAAFQLDGAHTEVECAKCHSNKTFRGVAFGECSDCHKDPHGGALGASCAGCHVSTAAFATTNVDHNATGFPLSGEHARVPCASCHRMGSGFVSRPEHNNCSSCHSDAHAGNFNEDCAACHTVNGFAGATLDHTARTDFALQDRHAEIPCIACHKQPTNQPRAAERTVDFRGLSTACESCHADPHNGDLGTSCASCHGTRSFRISSFQHTKAPEFFHGKHATADCAKCHKAILDPERIDSMVSSRTYRGLSTSCASCHGDPHLGQLGADCASCHAVDEKAFDASLFDHSRTDFKLTGRHALVPCETCHKEGSGVFPAGSGKAVRFTGMSDACVTCHRDPHLGELGTTCQSCHSTGSFAVTSYTHRDGGEFFEGEHADVACESCHRGLAAPPTDDPTLTVLFSNVSSEDCATCHDDVHKGTLGTDCATCHTTFAPFTSASRAFHKDTLMPLEGRHLAVPCAECHLDGQIKATPTRCYDCHWIRRQDDRFRTALGTDCEQCHRPISWTAVNWDHGAATGVPLAGAHFGLDCDTCHTGGNFEGGTPSDCVACHFEDYQGADDPDHTEAGFPTDCELCHSPSDGGWDRVSFNHASFQLVGTHATLDCAECHSSGVYQGLPAECVDCHSDNYQDAANPNHNAAGFDTECETCHRGSDPSWQDGQYPHSIYPLVATHQAQPCNACHSSNVFQGLPSDCVDCHLADYQDTDDPDHAASGFPTDCVLCHSVTSPTWDGASFDHQTFQLAGAHTSLDCADCHSSGVYQGLPSDCVDCHLADYQDTDDPDHAASGFPTDCVLCHSVTSPTWDGASFDHQTFQLAGAHTSLDCADCHSSGVYQGLPSDCVDCHLADYQDTDDPDHAASGFPTDCVLCHAGASPTWEGATFDHTTFQLAGAHTTLDCADCHSNGVYQGLPSDCVDCHLTDYQDTDDPDHAASGFSTDCVLCHSGTSPTWEGASFDHQTFQLAGAHTTLDCADCHSNGVYQGLPSNCVDCHLTDYQGTDDPDHAASGFPTDCVLCHSVTSPTWEGATFDHQTFQLVGTHAALDCAECHSSGVYQGLPAECVDCHSDDYQQADDPNHNAAGFDTECETCHQGSDPSWDDGHYPHSIYPLVATHEAQPCNACHSSNVFQGLPSECVDCHLADYQQADDPDHVAAGFPTDCELCHPTTSPTWTGASFDHSSFQLQGAHTTLDCAQCHSGGVYQGLPSDCVDCHLGNYQQTNDPDHVDAGFPTDCELCHSAASSTWTGASFDHTTFQLLGAHATADCAQCHSSGVYQGLPSDCVDCHLSEYQQANDPDHIAAGFPTTCDLCHRASDLSWDQGTFDHLWFPINSGDHRNIECSECHRSGSNFAVFTCTTSCHPRSEMDGEHDDVQGYAYNSAQCYSCHPNGEADFGRPTLMRSHESR